MNRGGMFGYSLSSSSSNYPSAPVSSSNSTNTTATAFDTPLINSNVNDPNSKWSYLAVGQPWDSTVYVYATLKPQPIVANNGTNSTSYQYSNVTGEWIKIQLLLDSGNGTWPLRGKSMFGYSVSITDDGKWLAVGIPGRTYTALSESVALEYHSYAGSVRIYRLSDPSFASSYDNGMNGESSAGYDGGVFVLVEEVENPYGNSFWQKFGYKVQIRKGIGSNYMLITSSNAGWDGASTKFYAANPSSPEWPIQPQSMQGAGVFVYQIDDDVYQQNGGSSGGTQSGLARLFQYIPLQSYAPLGSLGIEFDSWMNPLDQTCQIFIRDYILPSAFTSSCPQQNCSFVTVSIDGIPTLINATGVVIQYSFPLPGDSNANATLNQVRILSRADFSSFGVKNVGWRDNDFFGAAISVAYDPLYQRHVLAIGAPRYSIGVFTYYSDDFMETWIPSVVIVNPSTSTASYFGQKLKFSSKANFLIISDAVDPTTSLGGNVFVYHRRSEFEILVDYQDLNLPKSTNIIQYDLIDQLFHNGTFGDQFGFGLGSSENSIFVGSHVTDTFFEYSYPDVQMVTRPPNPLPVETSPYPSIYAPSTAAPSMLTKQNGWKLGVIMGCIGFICGLLVFLLMYRYHKMKVMRDLKAKKAQETQSNEQLDTRTGTQESLAMGSGATLSSS